MMAAIKVSRTVSFMDFNVAWLVLFAVGVVAVLFAAVAVWRSATAAAAALDELTEHRRSVTVGRVVGPARRLVLELEVPSQGGLPQWGFANIDPTREQVELFTAQMCPLAELVRHRLLECAAAHPDQQIRNAAAVLAVRANAAWASTVTKLHGEVAARSSGEEHGELDRAAALWRRFAEELELFAELLADSPVTTRVEIDHAQLPKG